MRISDWSSDVCSSELVDGWLTASASPQVPELVEATGMSIRSVERMTKHYYGLSPRMLARKYRAVRAASALARGEGLDSAQLGDAFYDQSHQIGRAHVCTPVTNAHLVCRLLLEK